MAQEIRPLRKDAVVYKLTDQHMKTHGGYPWELGKVNTVTGTGNLCGPGWLHVYSHPWLAVLLNPIHAIYQPCRLFKAIANGVYRSDGSLKAGVSSLVLVEELPVPVFRQIDYVVWAILVTRAIPDRQVIPVWETWADEVLKTGRTGQEGAAAAARAAAGAGAAAAARAAAEARAAAAARAAAEAWAAAAARAAAEAAAEA